MTLDHVGIEVKDLYAVELFYRKALGFTLRYRYVSHNTPGLRTVFLERDGVRLELLERPRPDDFLARRAFAPDHLSLRVPDVDAEHARLAGLGFPGALVGPPRNTGDGFRELTLRDPEGNLVEISARIGPEPLYPVRAVLFDLDGTLADTERQNADAVERVLSSGIRRQPWSAVAERRDPTVPALPCLLARTWPSASRQSGGPF